MSTTVTYKGSTLTTVNNQTRTLKTAGKYMEGDVILTDVTEGGGGSVTQDQDGFIVLPKTGGGGGGSSDFSTANVTITKAEGKTVVWKFPTIISDKLIVDNYEQQELTETHPVVLYKGVLEIYVDPGVFSITSGNVTEDHAVLTITGDCSLQYIGF